MQALWRGERNRMRAKQSARFHLIAAAVWVCLSLPTLIWWKDSILWVSLMSIYAIVIAHLAAYQAAHGEKKQEESRK